MNNKCIVCDKDISDEDIFTKVEINMHSLIYDDTRREKDFLVPNGPIHLTEKFYLCNICSHGLMAHSVKDIATAIVKTCTENKGENK